MKTRKGMLSGNPIALRHKAWRKQRGSGFWFFLLILPWSHRDMAAGYVCAFLKKALIDFLSTESHWTAASMWVPGLIYNNIKKPASKPWLSIIAPNIDINNINLLLLSPDFHVQFISVKLTLGWTPCLTCALQKDDTKQTANPSCCYCTSEQG